MLNGQLTLTRLVKIFSFPMFILFIQVFLVGFDIYARWPLIDNPMHFFGGLSVGVSYFLLLKELQKSGHVGQMHGLVGFVVIVSVVGITAVGWEFFEFLVDKLIKTGFQGDIVDTMKDLFLGLLGGGVGCVLVMKKKGGV